MGKFLYLFKRLREPSSMAAISSFCAMMGINSEDMNNYWQIATVVFGGLGVFIKEGQPETQVKGFD